MNSIESVFEYLQDSLIEWKPKTTLNNVSGEGFNKSNVVNIEVGALPNTEVFDYVYIAPPIVNDRGIATGTKGVQRSTRTYVIDMYCKRGGVGNAMKRATLSAMYENFDFVSNLFAKQGFIVTVPNTDLNYSGNSTARQVINITKTFVTN